MGAHKFRTLILVLSLSAGMVLIAGPNIAETTKEFSRSWPTMGTFASVTLDTDRPDTEAQRAVEAVRAVFDRINRTMTVYSPNSDLTRVNRWTGIRPVVVDPWVADLLHKSKLAHEKTGGAFSIGMLGAGVKAGLKPNHTGRSLPRAPTCTEISLLISTSTNLVYNPCPGTGFDLGGIAKGYALDRAAKALNERGFDRYMIELGRSLRAGQPPRGHPGWPVQFETGDRSIWLKQQALSVSRQGTRSDTGHILDPVTGKSIPTERWIAVEASKGWVSDMASTALLVDPTVKLRLMEAFPSIQRIWIQFKLNNPPTEGRKGP